MPEIIFIPSPPKLLVNSLFVYVKGPGLKRDFCRGGGL